MLQHHALEGFIQGNEVVFACDGGFSQYVEGGAEHIIQLTWTVVGVICIGMLSCCIF